MLSLILLLGGCGSHNPLLGHWTFERYKGGGDLGSVLGGFASDLSKGTVIDFTPKAMIITQNGQKDRTPIDHYRVEGNHVEVWLRVSATETRAEKYVVYDHGKKISHTVTTGMKEVFARKRHD